MPIPFSPADREAFTRRQVNILTENESFDITTASLLAQKASLLQVDTANDAVYSFYDLQARQYEIEARLMDGGIPALYSPTELITAAQLGIGGVFYPNTPPVYTRSIPLINDFPNTNNTVKGRFHLTGTDPFYELNLMSNTSSASLGIEELIEILTNGITGVSPAATSILTFDGVEIEVTIGTATNFSVGEYVYVGISANSGIYKITNVNTIDDILTVEDVIPSASPPSTGTVDNTVAGFNAGERQTLVSATWQEILTNLTSMIATRIASWELKIDAQIVSLNLQNDDRVTQAAQNVIALADVANTKAIIDFWQALPNTGVGARYTSAGISPISSEVNARQSFIPTRISQIAVALGTTSGNALTQSGDAYSTGDPTNSYYKRYQWLNIRINRSSGSLTRYYRIDQAKNKVDELKSDNLATKAIYDTYFLTTAITFVEGTNIIYVKDVAGFVVSDNIRVVSKTQPEILATIDAIFDDKMIRISMDIPQTYNAGDIMRMFKIL